MWSLSIAGWVKDKPSNFAQLIGTLKYHEDVAVFMQRLRSTSRWKRELSGGGRYAYVVDNSRRTSDHLTLRDMPKRFDPTGKTQSVQPVSTGRRQDLVHPTQKPVALMEYLIRTYTNAGRRFWITAWGLGRQGWLREHGAQVCGYGITQRLLRPSCREGRGISPEELPL